MADLDTGHIFLTTLAPIKKPDPNGRLSAEQWVRIKLAGMAPAMQSPAAVKSGENSPFSRNRRTHLARMFVLNNVIYNGRVGKNTLWSLVKGIFTKKNLHDTQLVDELNCSYLVFCADIDAVRKDGDPLPTHLSAQEQAEVRASYARDLWETMEPELRAVYENCVGFDNVNTGDQFAAYLEKCHVETTMPFHDYYVSLPTFHRLPVKILLAAVVVPFLFACIGLLLWLFGSSNLPWVGWPSLWTFAGGLVVTLAAAFLSVKYVLANGAKPLAPGEFDDLPSVLKGLYLQQHFADFMVDHQGVAAAQLHADFGDFLKQHQPGNKDAPTQPPGVISISN